MPNENDQELISCFQEVYDTEVKARDNYNDILGYFLTDNERKVITSIRDDEIRHMQIAQKILDLIKADHKT